MKESNLLKGENQRFKESRIESVLDNQRVLVGSLILWFYPNFDSLTLWLFDSIKRFDSLILWFSERVRDFWFFDSTQSLIIWFFDSIIFCLPVMRNSAPKTTGQQLHSCLPQSGSGGLHHPSDSLLEDSISSSTSSCISESESVAGANIVYLWPFHIKVRLQNINLP